MPNHIIKPSRDDDFYVRYSTIVDSPTGFGTRAEMLEEIDAARLDRADQYGTSALWGYPLAYSWHDTSITVREGIDDPTKPDGAWYGEVARTDLREFCESLGEDGVFHPRAGLIAWVTADD